MVYGLDVTGVGWCTGWTIQGWGRVGYGAGRHVGEVGWGTRQDVTWVRWGGVRGRTSRG